MAMRELNLDLITGRKDAPRLFVSATKSPKILRYFVETDSMTMLRYAEHYVEEPLRGMMLRGLRHLITVCWPLTIWIEVRPADSSGAYSMDEDAAEHFADIWQELDRLRVPLQGTDSDAVEELLARFGDCDDNETREKIWLGFKHVLIFMSRIVCNSDVDYGPKVRGNYYTVVQPAIRAISVDEISTHLEQMRKYAQMLLSLPHPPSCDSHRQRLMREFSITEE